MVNQGASLEFLWMSDEDSLFEILEILYSYLVFAQNFFSLLFKTRNEILDMFVLKNYHPLKKNFVNYTQHLKI